MTPSKAAAQASTKIIGSPDVVSGFLTTESLRMTKDGNFTLTLRNNKRRCIGDVVNPETGEIIAESYFADKANKQEDGSSKVGFEDGEFMYRSYRLDVRADGKGLDVTSLVANLGGKQLLFPERGPVRIGAAKAEEIFNRIFSNQPK
jgi:hypothetical protein